MPLTDQSIRANLIDFLKRRTPRPNEVIEELRLHNGNAIADVVAVHQQVHCYEIKSDIDSLQRVLRQAQYYKTTFPKITLVTTKKHLCHAIKIIPEGWGVLLAKEVADKVTFTYVRKACYNRDIEKSVALSMLWRSELIDIASGIEGAELKKRLNRSELASYIAENKSKKQIVTDITLSILFRHKLLREQMCDE